MDLSALLSLMIALIVIGAAFWLFNWLIDYCTLPEPVNKVAKIVLAVLVVLALLKVLIAFANGSPLLRF